MPVQFFHNYGQYSKKDCTLYPFSWVIRNLSPASHYLIRFRNNTNLPHSWDSFLHIFLRLIWYTRNLYRNSIIVFMSQGSIVSHCSLGGLCIACCVLPRVYPKAIRVFYLASIQGLSGSTWDLSGNCPVSIQDLSGIYPRSIQDLSRIYLGSFQDLSGINSGSIQDLSGIFLGYIRDLYRIYPGSIQVISRVYPDSIRGRFQEISGVYRGISIVYPGYIWGIARVYQGLSGI